MLCALLQRDQNPSGAKQGCAALSRRSASWNHQITRNPRRTSSPIRPDLVFATHSSICQCDRAGTIVHEPRLRVTKAHTAVGREQAHQHTKARKNAMSEPRSGCITIELTSLYLFIFYTYLTIINIIHTFSARIIMTDYSNCVKPHIRSHCFSSLSLAYNHVTLRVSRCRPSKGFGIAIVINDCSCHLSQKLL